MGGFVVLLLAVCLARYAAAGRGDVYCCDPDAYIMDLVFGYSQNMGEKYASTVTGNLAQDRSKKLAAEVYHYTDANGNRKTEHQIHDFNEPARTWKITDGKHCSLEREWRQNYGCVEGFLTLLPSVTYGTGADKITVNRYEFGEAGEGFMFRMAIGVTKENCLPFSLENIDYEEGSSAHFSQFNFGRFQAVQPDANEWFTVPGICPKKLPEGQDYIESGL